MSKREGGCIRCFGGIFDVGIGGRVALSLCTETKSHNLESFNAKH